MDVWTFWEVQTDTLSKTESSWIKQCEDSFDAMIPSSMFAVHRLTWKSAVEQYGADPVWKEKFLATVGLPGGPINKTEDTS